MKAAFASLVLAIGLVIAASAGGTASAHTGGMLLPSTATHFNLGGSGYTGADDNVTDGHCVYAAWKRSGIWNYNGAYSCGPVVTKFHSAPNIVDSRKCISGHWVCL